MIAALRVPVCAVVSQQRGSLQRRVWVARLMRHRSRTGHTAVCWAVALDHQEIIDVLYTHGANLNIDDDVLVCSVDLIKVKLSVRLSL